MLITVDVELQTKNNNKMPRCNFKMFTYFTN